MDTKKIPSRKREGITLTLKTTNTKAGLQAYWHYVRQLQENGFISAKQI